MILFIMVSSPKDEMGIKEGLRMISSFIGMDRLPVAVFVNKAIRSLLPGALEGRIYEYLKVAGDLSSINVLEEDLKENDLDLEDLDNKILIEALSRCEFIDLLSESRIVVTF